MPLTQTQRNARYMRRLREARDNYLRLLRRVERIERERDRLRAIARQRLELVESQAGIIRAKLAELEGLRESAAAMALEDSGVPTVEP